MADWRRALGFVCVWSTWLGCRGESVGDVAQVDAAPPSDADAGTVAGGELLSNPGFELGCAGWETAEATAEERSVARTGSGSCRVCRTDPGRAFFLSQTATTGFTVGERYVGEAWLHAADGDAAPEITPRLVLLDGDDNELGVANGTTLAVDATWKRTGALIDIKPGTKKLVFETWGVSSGVGRCYLIDDASLRPVR